LATSPIQGNVAGVRASAGFSIGMRRSCHPNAAMKNDDK
jgi:hypothetical protein